MDVAFIGPRFWQITRDFVIAKLHEHTRALQEREQEQIMLGKARQELEILIPSRGVETLMRNRRNRNSMAIAMTPLVV